MITLKTLPQATAQQVYDQVKAHLLKQGKKCTQTLEDEPIVRCRYKADGMSCAAGCLISDDEYKNIFEGIVWKDLVNLGHAPKDHEDLIVQLQQLHDFREPEAWKYHFRVIAEKFNLIP